MTRFFDRTVELTIARAQGGDNLSAAKPNGVVIRNLRVAFQIEKSLEPPPNPATITVSNLSPDTRTFLQQKPVRVDLQAGYGDERALLFRGWVRSANPVRTTTGWDVIVQLGDGDRAYNYGRVSRSFAAGTDAKTALAEVAKTMGLKLPKSASEAKDLAKKFATGVTVAGPSRGQLSKLLAPSGRTWSIQDGELQILEDRGVRASTAIVVSQDQGMIGVPQIAAPTQAGEPPVTTVQTLLDPAVLPGGKISLRSDTVTGTFKVRKVVHTGDTHGEDWTTTIEGTPL